MADQSTADIENLSPKDKTDLSSSNNNNNNAERPAQGPSPKKDEKKKDRKKKKRDKKRDKKGDHIDHEQEQEDDDHYPGEDHDGHDGHDVVGEGDGDGDGDGGTLGGGECSRAVAGKGGHDDANSNTIAVRALRRHTKASFVSTTPESSVAFQA